MNSSVLIILSVPDRQKSTALVSMKHVYLKLCIISNKTKTIIAFLLLQWMSESRHAQYRSFLLWRHNQVICSNAFNDTARHTRWSKIQRSLKIRILSLFWLPMSDVVVALQDVVLITKYELKKGNKIVMNRNDIFQSKEISNSAEGFHLRFYHNFDHFSTTNDNFWK